MKAVRHHRFGPPEVLVLEEVPDPAPGPGQLLVRVAAAGINYADVLMRGDAGPSARFRPVIELPVTPGLEVAGTVLSAGPDTDTALVGRKVTAFVPNGGYAELALVPAAGAVPVPEGLDDNRALALLSQGATAVGVIDAAALTAEDTVLVEAAGGGIGSLLVQLAVAAGATVVAAASSEAKLDVARRFGAHRVVNYSEADWAGQVGPVTVVLETVGGKTATEALQLLSGPRPRIVLYGFASGTPAEYTAADLFAAGATLIPFSLGRNPELLPDLNRRALDLGTAGRLSPVIGDVRPLAEAAAAHRSFEDRTAVGKIILTP
ncbi:quinone oxidoreductase family protein [Kutzneria sp. CA-103260]|uniref:quinone oxidoreductase family protein n=1 Tax=Kutzneria sp. CA-103260 TaxID=2802641 RepID=UPI001BA76E60|nr:zinc-binding dehydrogenase [Kutzneria sp. CA-103260]QUQ71571.1 NADPH:quinone reductase-dependent oxidoreductase [Kutzneria sp. CA-103260]